MKKRLTVSWSALLNITVLLLVFFVLLPQVDQFSNSIDTLSKADGKLVIAAFLLGVSTLLFSTRTYVFLEPQLLFGRTLMVQFASTFTNRLLPAGIGGLSLMVRYMQKERIKLGKAVSIAGLNNVFGFIGHMLLFALAFVIEGDVLLKDFAISIPPWTLLIVIACGILSAIILWKIKRTHKFITRSIREARDQIATYALRPSALLGALSSTMMVSILYISCFYISTLAVGLSVSLASCLVVFSMGVLAGSLTPTPGGLVGVEAGLLTGLIALGQPEGVALSAVLLYRLITYWAPLLPGYIMFRYLQLKKII